MTSAPFAAGSETSLAAAESISPSSASVRRAVFGAFLEAGANGLTCDEIEVRRGMRHQTAAARIWELTNAGLLVKSGEKRRTRSGRFAAVLLAAAGAVANDPRIDTVTRKAGAPRVLPADPELARDNARLRARVAELEAALAPLADGVQRYGTVMTADVLRVVDAMRKGQG